jgi:3-oxoadipate enol-lactonase/4-carboxymuconolactone decarboxylase
MFIKVRDIIVHVQIDGPSGAPALLLVHALGTALAVWDQQAAALSRSFRVVRPDLRGHGLSEVTAGPYSIAGLAEDMLALLDVLGIQQAHAGGLSIGGMIVQALADLAPGRIMSLVLCDTAMAILPSDLWRQRAGIVRSGGMRAIADSVVAHWVTPDSLDASSTHGLRRMLLCTDPEGYAGAAEAIVDCDLFESTAKLVLPTLILIGEQDQATPMTSAEALRDAIAGAELQVLPGAAHIPTMQIPDIVSDAMRRFLSPDFNDFYTAGMQVRKQVLGDSHVARATGAITDFDRDFQTFITRTAWGGVWTRPHFDRRIRSLLTLALMAGLGHQEEFKLHVRASRNTGTSATDIAEMLIHVAAYAGIPAANSAFRMAKEILSERENPK